MTAVLPAATATPAAGVRCPSCGKRILEELAGRAVVRCPRCKKTVELIVRD